MCITCSLSLLYLDFIITYISEVYITLEALYCLSHYLVQTAVLEVEWKDPMHKISLKGVVGVYSYCS